MTNDQCRYRNAAAKSKQMRGKKECTGTQGCGWDSAVKGGGACQATSVALSFEQDLKSVAKPSNSVTKSCSELTKELVDQVKVNVKTRQKILDGLDKGERCRFTEKTKLLYDYWKKAEAAYKKASVAWTIARSATVKLGSVTFSGASSACTNFFNSKEYKDATTRVEISHKLKIKEHARMEQARKEYELAHKMSYPERQVCMCDVKNHHIKEWNAATDDSNTKLYASEETQWIRAHKMQCTLDDVIPCKVPQPPQFTKPKLLKEVRLAECPKLGKTWDVPQFMDRPQACKDCLPFCPASLEKTCCNNVLTSSNVVKTQRQKWRFRTDKAGSQWSLLPNGAIRWTVANDGKCGGTAHRTQKGTAKLNFKVLQGQKVRISMQGMGEAQYERLRITLNRIKIADVIADNIKGVCAVDTCNMCPVAMKPKEFFLSPGDHELLLQADTFDGEYHNGCYYDVFFADVPSDKAPDYDKCKSCQCGDVNNQVHPKW
jgi:hypothetical protein